MATSACWVKMNTELQKIAREYFEYMARSFPVMCASDEFDFMPRSETADRYYDRLDSLDVSVIRRHVAQLEQYLGGFQDLESINLQTNERIDLELLKCNVMGALIEFKHAKSWKHNPLLYLKVGFIGLDHALTKPADDFGEIVHRFKSRLSRLPDLLRQGMKNLQDIPESYHRAALSMVRDSKSYLREVSFDSKIKSIQGVNELLEDARRSLDLYSRFLKNSGFVQDQDVNLSTLKMRLREHFAVRRSTEEIYEIAREEWDRVLAKLTRLSAEIDPEKSWQELYENYTPVDGYVETHTLYRNEINHLKEHLAQGGLLEIIENAPLSLRETPTYLRSVRSSASFSAPFSSDPREEAIFYITSTPDRSNQKTHGAILKRLHKEYRFLTAHETYPGHHLLDTFRRKSQNPVRRQVESPLFYEGWAYYAESLPIESGYIQDPVEILVDLKRQLWRSARCQIDAGLASGKLTKEDTVVLLQDVNFSKEEAISQVNRFGLNPGYQLCYSLGRYEIKRLRKTYAPLLGTKTFHKLLLEGGELPFHLAELNLKYRTPGVN